jgi:probable rRNA maturation factor
VVRVERRSVSVLTADDLIVGAAERTLALENASGDVAIVLTNDDLLRELNTRYLGVDAATDVLSFPSGETDPDSGTIYLGDVVISVARAEAQAKAGGHAVEAEVQLLVVHGLLHLLGYDHADAGGKAEMWAAQGRALSALGLADIHIQE